MSNIDFISKEKDSVDFRNQSLDLYSCIKTEDDFRVFMENHIFTIWDYMSLLKALENSFRNDSLPWFPSRNAKSLKTLHEVVCQEEFASDGKGEIKSNFEMYLETMEEIGANTSDILNVLSHARSIDIIQEALTLSNNNVESSYYTRFIYNIIKSGKPHLMATVLALSKETSFPSLFAENLKDQSFDLKYPKTAYLFNKFNSEDSVSTSKNLFKLASELIGDDPHKLLEAKRTAKSCMRYRTLYLQGIVGTIHKQKFLHILNNKAS